jgi:osmotically inducible lipoprotein OsmB
MSTKKGRRFIAVHRAKSDLRRKAAAEKLTEYLPFRPNLSWNGTQANRLEGDAFMRRPVLAATILAAMAAAPLSARADMVGAAAGAGAGLVVAGPVGAVAGGVIGAVYGHPFWGPPVGYGACWTDNHFHRHCRHH